MEDLTNSIRPGKVFIITDTHFFHDRITIFCDRPTDFMSKIIRNWNAIVMPQDTIIHLGDLSWGAKERTWSIMGKLSGTKIMVRGNHDKSRSDGWLRDLGFSFVCQKTMINNIILSHMPTTLTEEEIKEGVINIHGHFHNIDYENWEDYLVDRLTDNHYLLSLEYVKYKPVLLNEAVEKGLVVRSKDLKNKGLRSLC